MMPNNKDNATATSSTTSLTAALARRDGNASSSLPGALSPMSLVGLQERAFHYQDLAARLQGPTPTSEPRAFASVPETRTNFRNHLLSVLDQALRIVNEDVVVPQEEEEEEEATD